MRRTASLRWRRIDLKRVIAERFCVEFHPRYVGKLLQKLGFSPISTPIFLPSRAPELNPVENAWQYLRQNWLSNTVFENYDAISDAACAASPKLIAQPETITAIGMREWAHVGQPL